MARYFAASLIKNKKYDTLSSMIAFKLLKDSHRDIATLKQVLSEFHFKINVKESILFQVRAHFFNYFLSNDFLKMFF